MVSGADVLRMLIPNGGWVIYGDDYEGIQFLECEPVTKEEFEAGFAQVEIAKAEAEAEAAAQRQALLFKLGITEEEAKLLLS